MTVIDFNFAKARRQQQHVDYLERVAKLVAEAVEERGWDGEVEDLKDLTHREAQEMIVRAYAHGSPIRQLFEIGLAQGALTTCGKFRQWGEECEYLLALGKAG